MKRLRNALPPLLFLGMLLGAWELYVKARGVENYILPAPSEVWSALVDMAPNIGPDIRATATEAIVGLLIAAGAGAAFALLIAAVPFARRAVYPLLVISQTIPAIVLAPLLVVWLGFGMLPKIVMVALVGFFPIVVGTVDALVGADRERIELVRSFGASRAGVLRLVQVPEALPAFFAGLKIAATYAVIAAVIGEWIGTSEGLGLVMERARRSFQTDEVLAAVVVVALVSLTLFALVSVVARLATPWTVAGTERREDA
jgi:ABC-type nitrate/sulfonate/bicarbonate transport system permease component